MIQTFFIIYDDKLINNKFSININNNYIIINPLNITDNIIKIPIYNKYNGLDYVSISFPLELPIINNYVFNPYIILSSYNFNDLPFDEPFDFFSNLSKTIKTNFNYDFLSFDDILNNKIDFISFINENYSKNISIENLNNELSLNEFIKLFWLNINIIKTTIIYKLINGKLKQKKMKSITNYMQTFKYKLLPNNSNNLMTFIDYYNFNYDSLPLDIIKPDNEYYIIAFDDEQKYPEKIIKIYVKSIDENIITINNDKKLLYSSYKWYYFHPLIKINKDTIIYQTYLNNVFTNEIIKLLIKLDDTYTNKILYFFENKQSYNSLIPLSLLYNNLKQYLDDISILNLKIYSNDYFKYITKKNIVSEDKLIKILDVLFQNYKYPLKTNRHEFDTNFDQILYISICNILYGCNSIFIDTDNNHVENIVSDTLISEYTNTNTNFNNYNLNPNINNIIPSKLKNLYINIIRTIIKILNNNYDNIIFNQKYYTDPLHKSIIKILIYDNNTNNLTVSLFKNIVKANIIDKIKNIYYTNLLLIDITNKINWNNLSKKLYYLNYFYKNKDIIYYQNRINKNIISANIDNKILKIIENPFEMYSYLKKEKDFIRWTSFISNYLDDIYYTPITIDNTNKLGILIYLLYNIEEQNIKNPSYIKFLDYCINNSDIILYPKSDGYSNRINLKIKDVFTIKIPINLGFLAKHLSIYKNNITFDTIPDDENKNSKLINHLNKKYMKYKNKYKHVKYNKYIDSYSDTSESN